MAEGSRRSRLVVAAAATAAALACAPASASAFDARGSVEQVYVTGATPGQTVKLLRGDRVVASRPGGELGGVVFRKLRPDRYRVRAGGQTSKSLRVVDDRPRPHSRGFYRQTLPAGGYGYLRTRDGTKLAISVRLPGPADEGPYPTLVEYSGYGYADPAGPESGIAPVANLMGYAVVDVNMRGTGCSGGSFDYFETLQALDGYDVIETVARQPWVKGDRVGMIGISYGGISQLFVAAQRPPSLAAIAPLSVIDNTQTTLYPGGILNTGFALSWAQDRVGDAEPASPTTGQPWAWQRIQNGDDVCERNQDLHPEAVDLIAKIRSNRYYRPKVADPLAPVRFVDRIDVPVFLACQWQDEQTGGHCPTLVRRFTGTDRKWFTFTNGTHSDSLDPATFNRWFDFLELYVARRRPVLSDQVRNLAPFLYASLMGTSGVNLPPDPIQDEPDYASAKAAFEAQRPVRILFENGAGDSPGKPINRFERSFGSFPPSQARARPWYLDEDGTMSRDRPARGAEQFTWDPEARPPTNFTGNTSSGPGGLWTATPPYDWSQNPPGRALSYVSGPLGSSVGVLGGGAVEAWVRSSAPNVDLQATVSEVRPDGKETFVQGGWLRTDARVLDPLRSTLLEPLPSYRRRDATTLPAGRWTKVTIPLYYQGHVYREGSRLRVTISAPGGDQPVWAFGEAQPDGKPWVAIARGGSHRSRLLLPVIRGIDAPEALPPCPSLRGQPCRSYAPFTNVDFPLPDG